MSRTQWNDDSGWPSAPTNAPSGGSTLGQRRRGASPSYHDQNNAYNPYASSSQAPSSKSGFSMPEANPFGSTSIYPSTNAPSQDTNTSNDYYGGKKSSDSYGASLHSGQESTGWYGNTPYGTSQPFQPSEPQSKFGNQQSSLGNQQGFGNQPTGFGNQNSYSVPEPPKPNGFFQAAAPMLMAGMASALGDTSPANTATQMGFQFAANQFQQATSGVNQNVGGWFASLKRYFNVTNSYVLNKIKTVLFPWRHRPWSRSRHGESYATPREDLNAPDLYIPVMAFVTYVLLVGVSLGRKDKFHPALLGSTSSTALAIVLTEVVFMKLGCYLLNIPTVDAGLADIMAYSGYKFVGIIVTMMTRIIFDSTTAVLGTFAYCMLAYGFFLLRTLKYVVLPEPFKGSDTATLSPGVKQRRIHFLFLVAGVHILMSYLLLRVGAW